VWETNASPSRRRHGYPVIDPAADTRRDYRAIYDVSGDRDARHPDQPPGPGRRGGAGRLLRRAAFSFQFAPAFMREARIRIAANGKPADLWPSRTLAESGRLSLDGLITHRAPRHRMPTAAYRTAFGDPACLKMVLDWRTANDAHHPDPP
jgi:3-hydroxyethyl bacteriochlorophyllide a dehydrogenase